MSAEYKPKYEIGSEFYSVDEVGGYITISKRIVDEIRQTAKDTFEYVADGVTYEVSRCFDTLKNAKEEGQKLVTERAETNKKAIEEYEG